MAVWVCKRLRITESAKVVKCSSFLWCLIVNEFFGNGSSFRRRSNRSRMVILVNIVLCESLFPLVSQKERVTTAVWSWLTHHARHKPLTHSLIVHYEHLVLLLDWHGIVTVERIPALVELIIHIILVLSETKMKRSIEIIVTIETSLAILRWFRAWSLALVETVNQRLTALRSYLIHAAVNTVNWTLGTQAIFSSISWRAILWSFLWTVLHDIFNELLLS